MINNKNQLKKAKNRFYYIKKLINSTNDVKMLVDGQFYYNQKAHYEENVKNGLSF